MKYLFLTKMAIRTEKEISQRRMIGCSTPSGRFRPSIGLFIYMQLLAYSPCLASSCPSIYDNSEWRENLYTLFENCGPLFTIENCLNNLKHDSNESSKYYFNKDITFDASRTIPSTSTHWTFKLNKYNSKGQRQYFKKAHRATHERIQMAISPPLYSKEAFLPTREVIQVNYYSPHELWIRSTPVYNTIRRLLHLPNDHETNTNDRLLPHEMKYDSIHEELDVTMPYPLDTFKQHLKLEKIRTKWNPSRQNSCENIHLMTFEDTSILKVLNIGKPAVINPDLICNKRGDKCICLSFTLGIAYTPDECVQDVIARNLQSARSGCEFITQEDKLIIFSPIQIKKNTFTLHRDRVVNGKIILEEAENETCLTHKARLNVTSYYDSNFPQFKLSSLTKIYDDKLNSVKSNTDPISDEEGCVVTRKGLSEHDLKPRVFEAINLQGSTQFIKM